MEKKSNNNEKSRREFLNSGVRYSILGLLTAVSGGLILKRTKKSTGSKDLVWQIDPHVCIKCGRCATECVLKMSAVKCMHNFSMCGYCKLCFGYFQPGAKQLTQAAENQICPTGAIKRKFIEHPYFEYFIDEDLCNGCGKCVKGCNSFGNGSLFLQVNQDICVNCNECSIADACPSNAFKRVVQKEPYIIKGKT